MVSTSPDPSPNGQNRADVLDVIPEQNTWEDNYSERPFDNDKKDGQWQDWAGIMRLAINPPIGSLEDILRRTPIPPGIDQAEVDILWKLMIEQINAPCSQYNLELRYLQEEMSAIKEILRSVVQQDEDDPDARLDLNPKQWEEFKRVLPRVPSTPRGCEGRMDAIQVKVGILNSLIDDARGEGVYYDVCGLLDWFSTPADRRRTSSPSHELPSFGRVLFGILGLNAQNTDLAHIEAVASRQLAPKFGGSYSENEKTRYRNGADSDQRDGTASNAPGAPR